MVKVVRIRTTVAHLFHKQLSNLTVDYIERRVCRDEDIANKGVAIEIVESEAYL